MHPVARRLVVLVVHVLLFAVPLLATTALAQSPWAPVSQPPAEAPLLDPAGEATPELPPGVGEDWWSAARRGIEASEYHVTWQSQTPFPDLPSAWQAPNRAHDFRTWFGETGVRLAPRREETPSWEWRVSLVAWGRPDALRPLGPARLVVAGNRVDANRGELVEWFVNDERGLEQGFTLDVRPEGEGTLVLDLAIGGSLSAVLAEDGLALDFTAPNGRRVLHYGQLVVTDAGGAALAAHFESACGTDYCGIRIVVDDAGAAYPLTIDPLATSPAWTVQGMQFNSWLGYSVAPAGDVNRDGYDDVLVGVPFYDYQAVDRGRVQLYLGSASGLPVTPSRYYDSPVGGALLNFGYSVATAGDYNDDGFSDFLVGAPTRFASGAAYLYCGGPGAPFYPCRSWQGGPLERLGWTVATAGDISGDGISDILIAAPGYTNGPPNAGIVRSYFGAAGGGDIVPDWSIEGTVAHPAPSDVGPVFGRAIGTAGDVNGDGYSDLFVTDPYIGLVQVAYGSASGPTPGLWQAQEAGSAGWSALAAGDVDGDGYGDLAVGAPGARLVRVYKGGASGLDSTRMWMLSGAMDEVDFGSSVGTAGDVNGDAYSDLIVSCPRCGANFEGAVFVFEGSPSGPVTPATWSASGSLPNGRYGYAVATAGDVNGDGFSDVLIGTPYENMGRAYLYLGGPAGLASTSSWSREGNNAGASYGYSVASAGDIDGDGYSDVIVGAVLFDEGETNEGKAFVYRGSANGLSTATHWTATSNQAEARMGYSVSSAGDVNGDGYSDVLVGARGYSNPDADEGAVFVWNGSESGLGATGTPANADWRAESNQASAYFGIAVASAGDVNGDGYGDIIVGASLFDDGQTDEGAAFVWHGSASGLGSNGQPTNADWKAFSNQASSRFGAAVGTAGDVNDDGFGEVLVGAYAYDAPDSNEGAAFAWYGSSSGLGSTGSPANADWTSEGNQAGCYHGYALAWAGDINGDGFSDVAVGAYLYDGSAGQDEGRVLLYRGSATGLPPPSALVWGYWGREAGARVGQAVRCAGDVNGDGYADLAVGAPSSDEASGADAGSVDVFYGGAAGLPSGPSLHLTGDAAGDSFGQAVASAGDVNGDGYGDLIVGAPLSDNPDSSEGSAVVFLGNEGRSRTFLPNQYNGGSGDALVIPRFGRSNDDFYVRFTGKAFGMLGRARFNIVSEVKWSRQPFDGSGTNTTTSEFDTFVGGSGFTARSLVQSGLQHWRMRPLFRASDSPFQRRGHAYQMPWAGQNEGDFRTSRDSDGDGFSDELDNCPEVYNPSQIDADSDGMGNECDNCPSIANSDQADLDSDDTGDVCDTCTDTDGDGFGNPGYSANTCAVDNCPYVANPGQEDNDADGVGNSCDNCGKDYNPGQENADGDSFGDICDTCTDLDGDGAGDPGFPRNTCRLDNCPEIINADQLDTDRDGSGDVCDDCTDGDHDGYGDPDPQQQTCPPDNCVRMANPGQEDADTDGTGDVCDACTDTDGDGFANPGFPASTCATDCRPDDNTIWSAPAPIDSLMLTRAPTGNLSWSPPSNPGATTIQYDAMSSRKANDWSLFEAMCILSDTTALTATEPSVPPPGQAYYYLVRAEGPCGSNMGTRSDGTPRIGRACP